MRELKYFNICCDSNIINEQFKNFLSLNSNNFFTYNNINELYELLNKKNFHIIIIKYNFEQLKQIRALNKNTQIIAILEHQNSTHLEESLSLTQIKLVEKIDSISDFVKTLKDCIKIIDSSHSNIYHLKNNFIYDSYNKSLFNENKVISLTKKETFFLDYLLNNSLKAVNYEEINRTIWNGSMTQDALRSLIKEIRKKTYKELIKNVSGIGYRIDL